MRKIFMLVLAISLAFVGCGKPAITIKDVPLLPRDQVLSSISNIAPIISPNSDKFAFCQRNDSNILNVWVWDISMKTMPKCVTNSNDRPIRYFDWDFTGNILYLKDVGGDENYHIYRADILNGKEVDLTPGKGFTAYVLKMNPQNPNEIAIGINDRDPEVFDVKKVNLLTGKIDLIYKNVDNITDYIIDSDYRVRVGIKTLSDGGMELLRMTDNKWESMGKIGFEDAESTYLWTSNKSDTDFYMVDSSERNTSALFKINYDTWQKKLVADDERSDVSGCVFLSSTDDIAAVAFNYEKKYWKVVDPGAKKDFDYLSRYNEGELKVENMSLADDHWIVSYKSDIEPTSYYLFDRVKKEMVFLNSNKMQIETPLAKMHPRVIKSRDGLDLVCYLSLPPWTDNDLDGVPDKPLPMILNVHGGPNSRDYWGYSSFHQLFANRGYAVMNVNFRGSNGFGKDFLNKGNGEWGGKMQDDLIDVVDWAIAQGIADPQKVAIYGGSYGGYAALAALTFTPDKFACAIDLVGISNLLTFMKTTPAYWKPFKEMEKRQVGGDPDTDEGRKYLSSKSPINFVDKIKKPLLIGHGLNDPRVNVAESEQIVKAMQGRNVPVVYCLFPDEGHGFGKWQNSFAFYAVVENFLAKHLGGRYEAYWYDVFKESSIQIKAGIEYLDDIGNYLPKRKY